MCIIILKGFGVKMPDDETLKRCFTRHSDGFGMAFSDNGTVHILKGAMKQDDMLKLVHSVSRQDQRAIMMHFRTATHGAVGVANCHPFPISTDDAELGSGDFVTKAAVAHNGILHSQLGNGIYVHKDSKLSDSAEFIKKYMPAIKPILKDPIGLEVLAGFVGVSNKIGFLYPETTWRINQWYENKGIQYSNESYKEYKQTYYASPPSAVGTMNKSSECKQYNYHEIDELGFRGPHYFASMVFPFKTCGFCGGVLHPDTKDRNNNPKEGHYTLGTMTMCCLSCHDRMLNHYRELHPPKEPLKGREVGWVGGRKGWWENGAWQADDRELVDAYGARFMCGD